jgi:hypothetical protein
MWTRLKTLENKDCIYIIHIYIHMCIYTFLHISERLCFSSECFQKRRFELIGIAAGRSFHSHRRCRFVHKLIWSPWLITTTKAKAADTLYIVKSVHICIVGHLSPCCPLYGAYMWHTGHIHTCHMYLCHKGIRVPMLQGHAYMWHVNMSFMYVTYRHTCMLQGHTYVHVTCIDVCHMYTCMSHTCINVHYKELWHAWSMDTPCCPNIYRTFKRNKGVIFQGLKTSDAAWPRRDSRRLLSKTFQLPFFSSGSRLPRIWVWKKDFALFVLRWNSPHRCVDTIQLNFFQSWYKFGYGQGW